MSTLSTPAAAHGERPPLDEQNPWPALDSFHEADRKFFRGRAEVTNELLRLVLRERVTVLYGVSGIGKSSLLEAGLFPLLRQQSALPVDVRFDFSSDDPDLTGQVKRAIATQAEKGGVEAPNHAERETLWEYFHRREQSFWDERNRLVMPVLVFDQFEELFTLGAERPEKQARARELLSQLADLAEGRAPQHLAEWLEEHPESAKDYKFDSHQYRILIGIREDYLAYLEDLRDVMPAIVLNRKRLSAMDGASALEVASQARRLISPEVAEQVVRFVARAGATANLADMVVEPALLSVMCSELNEKRKARGEQLISTDLLQGSKDEILRDFYHRATRDVSEGTRRFIEEELILDPGYRDTVALEAALRRPGVTEADIARLVGRRLVRIEERGGVRRVELTHDLLIGVIRESRDKRHLTEKAEEEKAAREAAEQRERAARRSLRRTRALAIVFVSLAVAAVVMAIWALVATKHARQAQHNTLVTLARSQVQQGETMHEQGDEDNLALAYFARALRVDPTFAAARPWIASLFLQGRLSRMVLPHDSAVNAAAFSPDGKWIVTACDDNSAHLWEAATGRAIGPPMRHNGPVLTVAFSPDGQWIATGSKDGTAQVWEAGTGKAHGAPMRHGGEVHLAVFSANSERVLTSALDDTARVWQASTGEVIARVRDDGSAAALSPDGKWVATAMGDDGAQVWDVEAGKPVGRELTHGGFVTSLAFSPDGKGVATTSIDNTGRVWDAATGRPVTPPLRHDDSVYSIAFSPDGTQVVTASADKTTRVWNARTGQPIGPPMRQKQMVATAMFSPDGKQVLTSSKSIYNMVRTFDARSGIELGLPVQEEDSIYSAAFSPDGKWILTASKDKTARMWPAFASRAVGLVLPHNDEVAKPVFSPDSRWVVTAPGDQTARIWEAATGKSVGRPIPLSGPLQSAAFSPDGKRIVTADSTGTAQVWEAASGEAVGRSLRHSATVNSAVFSPDGRWVVTASNDNTAQVWDAKTGNPIGRALRHADAVRAAVFSPNGELVLTASDDKTARLWKTRTGEAAASPMRHRGVVYSAEFSPDGRRVLTASADNTARLWRTRNAQQLAVMPHDLAVTSAKFSPNGELLVTVSERTAQMWDANGEKVGVAMQRDAAIGSAIFSPDNNWVLTGSYDTTAQLWEAPTGKPVGLPLTHDFFVLSAAFSPDGRWILTMSDGARVWPSPAAIQGPDALANLAEVVSGYQITALGTTDWASDIPERYTKLEEIGSTAQFGELTAPSLIKWYFALPGERTISPGLTLPVCNYIEQLMAAGEGREVATAFPAHALFCNGKSAGVQ